MSAALLGILAGAGPGVTKGLDSKEMRDASKSKRTINEAVESRDAESHEWVRGLAGQFGTRGAVDATDPGAWDQYLNSGINSVANMVNPQASPTIAAPPVPSAAAIPQAAAPLPQQAPGPQAPVQSGVLPMPGAQDGGPMQVPAQQMGPPAQAPQVGPPEQAGPPAAPRPTRRQRYNKWYGDTARYAVLTGGLEGYQKFQEMEDATSRQQILGYSLQAVQAMDENNVGEAMRAGNSALEVTPFDTGLQFVAQNGKLYMQGADGTTGEPLDANQLRAFTENNMKTPENYLEWKAQYEEERATGVTEKMDVRKQDETERAALRAEGQTDLELGIRQRNATSTRMQAEAYVNEGPGRTLLRKAQAYHALAAGDAALTRAAGEGEAGLQWSEENILKIEEMEKTAMGGGLGFGGPWMMEQGTNSQLNSDAISAAVETRIANPPNAMTHNDASTLSRLAYFDKLVDADGEMIPASKGMMDALRDIRIFTDDDGNFMVDYKGKKLIVPPHVGSQIQTNKQLLESE